MSISTISSREFNQNVSTVKKIATRGPVIITDRGRPAHVLLSIEDYNQLKGIQESIVDLLAMPGATEIDFEPPQLKDEMCQEVDLS